MTLHSGTVNFDFPIIFRGPKNSSFWSQNREKVEIEKSIKMRFFGSKIEISKSRSKNRFAGLKKARFLTYFSNAGLKIQSSWTEFWQNDEKSSPARSIFWKFQSSSQKSRNFSPAKWDFWKILLRGRKIGWEVQNPMRGKIDLVFVVTSKGWDRFFENLAKSAKSTVPLNFTHVWFSKGPKNRNYTNRYTWL